MSINKITNAPTPNEHIAKTNEVVDFCNNLVIPTVGNGTITITQGGTTKGSFTTNQSGNATINLDAGGTGGITDVKVDNTSVVSGGVANIDLTGYAQKSGAIFSGDVYAQSLYQKSTINPSNYVQSLTPETVNTYSANKTLSNISSTSSPNFDGQWVASTQSLTVSASKTTSPQEFNLKTLNYLPNDNNKYEVLVWLEASAGTGSASAVYLSSDIVSGNGIAVQKSESKYGDMNLSIPVTSTLKVQVTLANVGSITLSVLGYRRIGTNS